MSHNIKFNAIATKENGGILYSSPESGPFQHSNMKYNQEAGGEVSESFHSDVIKPNRMSMYQSVDDQMHEEHKITVLSPKKEVYETVDEGELQIDKQEHEREELNTTIVPGQSKFPIKYQKKPGASGPAKKPEPKQETKIPNFLMAQGMGFIKMYRFKTRGWCRWYVIWKINL